MDFSLAPSRSSSTAATTGSVNQLTDNPSTSSTASPSESDLFAAALKQRFGEGATPAAIGTSRRPSFGETAGEGYFGLPTASTSAPGQVPQTPGARGLGAGSTGLTPALGALGRRRSSAAPSLAQIPPTPGVGTDGAPNPFNLSLSSASTLVPTLPLTRSDRPAAPSPFSPVHTLSAPPRPPRPPQSSSPTPPTSSPPRAAATSLSRTPSLSRGASSAGLTDGGPAQKRASPSPKPAARAPPVAPPRFKPVSGSTLAATLRSKPPPADSNELLVIDIRPHAAYANAHVPGAVSVCVPSTLLRRPAFTLDKLRLMLTSNHDRQRIDAAPTYSRVVVYDADTNCPADGLSGGPACVLGILRKLEAAGSKGSLEYLEGGFTAYQSVPDAPLEDGQPPRDESGLGDSLNPSLDGGGGGTSGVFVQPRHLPLAAFQQTSTTASTNSLSLPLAAAGGPDGAAPDNPAPLSTGIPNNLLPESAGIGPAYGPLDSQAGGKPMSVSEQRTAANPFFDVVRQNRELSTGMPAERIPLAFPPHVVAQADKLPAFLRRLVRMRDEDAAEELARQFYRIEVSEQRRLMDVMEWLASRSQNLEEAEQQRRQGGREGYHPFSIGAGVELGGKNRYRNIFPFEYSRVKLHCASRNDCDYVNASFIHPIRRLSENAPIGGTLDGSTKESSPPPGTPQARRYIATQGPMDATYRDFWTVCWEQNVRVIVMLTKQREGGTAKCGPYWQPGDMGPLKLELVSSDGEEHVDKESSGFNFDLSAAVPKAGPDEQTTIRRIFWLSHSRFPDQPRRKVTQFQYVAWPDFDIPGTANALLPLLHEVHALSEPDHGPVVVHCSAGVGRTGSYIVVDAVLDALRSERKAEKEGRAQLAATSRQRSRMSISEPKPFRPARLQTTSPIGRPIQPGPPRDHREGSPMEVDMSSSSPPRASSSFPAAVAQRVAAFASADDVASDASSSSFSVSGGGTFGGSSLTQIGSGDVSTEPSSIAPTPDPHRSEPPELEDRLPPLPGSLSTLDEPICQVVEDVREQRMSMVATLRQFVFVHQAIVSGVLAEIEDEERQEKERLESGLEGVRVQ